MLIESKNTIPGDIIIIFFMLTICCIFYFISYNWYNSINTPSWGIDTIPYFILKALCFMMKSYNLYNVKKSLLVYYCFYILISIIIFAIFSFFICHNINFSIIGFVLSLLFSSLLLSQTLNDKYSFISTIGVIILTLYQIVYLITIKESNSINTFQNI